ncbi:MAG: amidohydrolase [Microthrixaceae bacterium]|jgi:predicted TIM-barrel fold metal-dependent hydrolase|nr:amidohydrolase [Microthrixaceae bacterium]
MPEPTGNAAFDAARAGGIVDTFLSFPDVKAAKAKVYDYIRKASLDQETQTMEMPAGYMFKDVPSWDEIDDPLELTLAEMDRFGITRFLTNVTERELGKRALRDHPDRFWGLINADPNQGMEALRTIDRAVEEWGSQLKAVHVWGTALQPSVAIDDKKMYPIYAKCVEVNLPIVLYVGVPGPRIPMAPQLPILLDEVCCFFPELKIVTRHGGEPWTELMVKMLLKFPNLYYSTSAFAPKYYPKDILDFANTRGADKIIHAGYWAAGLTLDRIHAELPTVPLRDEVWPKFLRENANRVFGQAGIA